MKTTTRTILTGSFALLLASTRAFAITDTWDGGGGDSFTFNDLNWADNTAPVSDLLNTDIILAGTVGLSVSFSDPLAAFYEVRSLTFNNTAGAFHIFSFPPLTIGAGGITNDSANTQVFGGPILLGTANPTFDGGNGGLSFSYLFTLSEKTRRFIIFAAIPDVV